MLLLVLFSLVALAPLSVSAHVSHDYKVLNTIYLLSHKLNNIANDLKKLNNIANDLKKLNNIANV